MGDSRSVPRITLYLWVLRVILIGLVAAALSFFLNLFLLSGFIAVVAGIIAIYLPFFLKTYKITVIGGVFCLEYGIIFRTTRLFPIKNAIYIKALKTPVLKALGLSTLKIKTVKSLVFVPELKSSDIEYLINYIEEEICEN